ncbi:MAG: class I SAM-dependent methyltransferase [Myxococcales bacterium]|nr:class I SAM-dependent methyltransferase [Myxococcales bacterium]
MELNRLLRTELPRILESDRARDLMQMMRERSEGRPSSASPELEAEAERLGWISGEGLTPLGQRVGDSMREFLYWEERGRRLPRRDLVPELRGERFVGKRVLEVGCGFGCNLLRLQEFTEDVVGVDVDDVYLAFGPLFARFAGLPVPETVCARGEDLPFPDASFDAVLVIGALQYMEIQSALREMARVLRPGGEAVLVLGHLSGYLRHAFVPNARRSLRSCAREIRDVVGMATYPWLGRRLSVPGSPIYPTRHRMKRYVEHAGMRVARMHDLGDETAFVLDRV